MGISRRSLANEKGLLRARSFTCRCSSGTGPISGTASRRPKCPHIDASPELWRPLCNISRFRLQSDKHISSVLKTTIGCPKNALSFSSNSARRSRIDAARHVANPLSRRIHMCMSFSLLCENSSCSEHRIIVLFACSRFPATTARLQVVNC